MPAVDIYSYKINIDKPEFDQSTYSGRFQHFWKTVNPLLCMKTSGELDEAKTIIQSYRERKPLPDITPSKLWDAKYAYNSSFHPDTGEKVFLPGRMSFQCPGNMLLTGALLQFYKSTPQVIFWQWFNQTFNAFVNYSNRSGDSPISPQRLAASYVCGSAGAVFTALYINSLVTKFPEIVARFVPYTAVVAANAINLSCMRSKDIVEGIDLLDENGNKVGKSTVAGKTAIFQVFLSRVGMCTPGMLLPPFVMEHLEKKGTFKRYPRLGAPLQVFFAGLFLTVTTPACCAIWPQTKSIEYKDLEATAQEQISKHYGKELAPSATFYYNKGL